MGDGGGGTTLLEVRIGGTGRCAELILTASGSAHDAVLASAVSALRAGEHLLGALLGFESS